MIADQIIIPIVNPDLFLASAGDITGMRYSACCNLVLAEWASADRRSGHEERTSSAGSP